MNELIIRMTGSVVESNFDDWKEKMMATIDAASAIELVTDDDFAWAEDSIKEFKELEAAIKTAKEKALSESKDITDMLSAVDEVYGLLAKTRLSFEKKVKAKKESIKADMISKEKDRIIKEINARVPVDSHFGSHDIELNSVTIKAAAAGKKTLDGMRKSLLVVGNAEIECKVKMIMDANTNMETILQAERDSPGLFHDKKTLAWKPSAELSAIIDARVSQFKYQLKLKEEAEAKKAETKLKEEAEAKKAETHPVKAEDPVQPFTDLPTETPPFSENKEAGPVSDFVFTVHMRCTVEQAKEVAKEVDNHFKGNPFIFRLNLSRA